MVGNAAFNNISVIIVAVSFIDGGNRSTPKKSPTCRKLLTNLSILIKEQKKESTEKR